jgi:hypothetical protein
LYALHEIPKTENAKMDRIADAFDKPYDSPEHRMLRENAWLVGPEFQCRYLLGMLLGRNEFRITQDEFLNDLTEYITSRTSPQAAMFCCTEHHCQFVVAFLERQFRDKIGSIKITKETKENRAMEVLLKHPDWPDEQIVAEVGATMKSVARWTTYRYARRCQKLYEDQVEGWFYPRPTGSDTAHES